MAHNQVTRLPDQTVSLLRSTINITSLADVLKELIQNALDAGAKRVDCWVNLERWGVRVSDDGHGMNRGALEAVAQRYGERLPFQGFRSTADTIDE